MRAGWRARWPFVSSCESDRAPPRSARWAWVFNAAESATLAQGAVAFPMAPKTASQPNLNVLLGLRSVFLTASHAPVGKNRRDHRGEVSRGEIAL